MSGEVLRYLCSTMFEAGLLGAKSDANEMVVVPPPSTSK